MTSLTMPSYTRPQEQQSWLQPSPLHHQLQIPPQASPVTGTTSFAFPRASGISTYNGHGISTTSPTTAITSPTATVAQTAAQQTEALLKKTPIVREGSSSALKVMLGIRNRRMANTAVNATSNLLKAVRKPLDRDDDENYFTKVQPIETQPHISSLCSPTYYTEDTVGSDDDEFEFNKRIPVTGAKDGATVDPYWKYSLDHDLPWVSMFPGPVRLPTKTKKLQLDFRFATPLVTLQQFKDCLSGTRGCIKLQVQVNVLQAALRLSESASKRLILVHSIDITHKRFHLPIAMDMQLYSCPPNAALDNHIANNTRIIMQQQSKDNLLTKEQWDSICAINTGLYNQPQLGDVPDVPWFPQATPNPLWEATPDPSVQQNTKSGIFVPYSPTLSYPVYPNTNSDEREMIFECHQFTEHPMFQRWIYADKALLMAELNGYDQIWDRGSPYHCIPCLPNERSKRDVQAGCYVQFICLSEWKEMKEYGDLHPPQLGPPLPLRIESKESYKNTSYLPNTRYNTKEPVNLAWDDGLDNAELFFFVPRHVLAYFIDQKFTDDTINGTYQMDKKRHLMRVDAPLYLKLNIPNSKKDVDIDTLELMIKAGHTKEPNIGFYVTLSVYYEETEETLLL
jgi:hypothetical protein